MDKELILNEYVVLIFWFGSLWKKRKLLTLRDQENREHSEKWEFKRKQSWTLMISEKALQNSSFEKRQVGLKNIYSSWDSSLHTQWGTVWILLLERHLFPCGNLLLGKKLLYGLGQVPFDRDDLEMLWIRWYCDRYSLAPVHKHSCILMPWDLWGILCYNIWFFVWVCKVPIICKVSNSSEWMKPSAIILVYTQYVWKKCQLASFSLRLEICSCSNWNIASIIVILW